MTQAAESQRVQEYEKLHVSMYNKMLQKNDYESCRELTEMFEMFLTHASSEFSRGLDRGQEIWK